MPLETFAGGALFGERHGSGAPDVVAMHGWGRNRSDFGAVLAGFDAIALDLPGFGSSPEPDAVWGAHDYAAVVDQVLGDLDGPVVLVGHSFGGRVATAITASRPERVSGLVLVGVPLLHRGDRSAAKPSLAFRMARWLNTLGIISDERMEQERRKRGSADYRAATGVMRDILVRAVAETYEAEMAKVTVPVRLVWGENDSEVPVSVAERAAEMFPDATLDVVLGVGHHVPLNAPDRVAAAIRSLQ